MKNKQLNSYLNKLDEALSSLSASERAELILEIKSHILEKSEQSKKSLGVILKDFGSPSTIAKKFLKEKGISIPKKKEKSGIARWVSISFISFLGFIIFLVLIALIFFTPVIEVNSDGVRLLGGMIQVEKNSSKKSYKNKAEINTNIERKVSSFDLNRFKKSLVIKNSSGNIKVVSKKDLKKVEISYDESYPFIERCKIDKRVSKETISFLVSSINSSFWESGCDLDLIVYIPQKRMNYDFSTGSGDVYLDKISGNVSVETGSGSVSGNGTFQALNVDTGSGDISIHQKMSLEKNVLWKINTGSGDATLFIPKSTKLQWELDTGSGKQLSEFPMDRNSSIMVEIDTGSGDASLLINK